MCGSDAPFRQNYSDHLVGHSHICNSQVKVLRCAIVQADIARDSDETWGLRTYCRIPEDCTGDGEVSGAEYSILFSEEPACVYQQTSSSDHGQHRHAVVNQIYAGANPLIDRVKWRHISMGAIRSPFCRSRPSYCVYLSGEDLSRYSDKIESVGLRKCPYKRYLTKKVMSE